jgi:hypothetical protein
LTAEAERFTRALLATGALPARAQTDAAHLAIAAAAKADYLLTWNCRHLANAQILQPRSGGQASGLEVAEGLHPS